MKDKGGDSACPPLRLALRAMMTNYQYRCYRIRGGVEATGVKPQISVQVFL